MCPSLVSSRVRRVSRPSSPFFFFNDTATTEIYTLSLHDALPIRHNHQLSLVLFHLANYADLLSQVGDRTAEEVLGQDRKSTRLNSSHQIISYAVFCLKKKKKLYTSRSAQRPYPPRSSASLRHWL